MAWPVQRQQISVAEPDFIASATGGAVSPEAAYDFRVASWELGYQPIAVLDWSKRPAHLNWQNSTGAPRVTAGASNTGILATGLRGGDIDVENRADVDTIKQIFLDVIGRLGPTRFRENSPRCLILFLAPPGTKPRKRVIDLGSIGKVELMGDGQQVVAHGFHPTGVQLQWAGGSPADLARDDLPILDEAMIDEIERRALEYFGLDAPAVRKQEHIRVAERPLHSSSITEQGRRSYALGALRSEARDVAAIGEGGRNARLNKAALKLGHFVAAGWLTEAEVVQALTEAAMTSGLRQPEIRKTIRSGLLAGMQTPTSEDALNGLVDDPAWDQHWATQAAKIRATAHAKREYDFDPETGEIIEERKLGGTLSAAASLELVNAADLANKPIREREWLALDLIPLWVVTLFSGDGGTGKSLLALQLAVSVALGLPWLGLAVKQGRVLYLSAEDDLDEVHRRLRAIAAALGIDLSQLQDLTIAPLAGHDAILAAEDPKTRLLAETRLWQLLVAAVTKLLPILIILDTSADLYGGDEIKRVQVRQFIGMLKRLAMISGAAVVLLSHPSVSGMQSGSGLSGSTAWNNSVRSRLYLTRPKDDDGAPADPNVRVLETMKANYGRTGEQIRLRWEEGRFICDEPQRVNLGGFRSNAAEEVFLALLAKFNMQGRPVSPAPSATYAPSQFEKEPEAKGIRKGAFTRAMGALLDQGRIEIVSTGRSSKSRKTLRIAQGRQDGDDDNTS